MKIFVTSDTHFGHVRVAELRGFDTVADHDRELVDRWNNTVGVEDIVYHLGDFSMNLKALSVVSELNGSVNLVAGNHDQCWHRRSKTRDVRIAVGRAAGYLNAGFHQVFTSGTILMEVHGKDVVLSHLPVVGDHQSQDRYLERRPFPGDLPVLCGHVHAQWRTCQKQLNVGVDVNDLRPIRIEEALREVSGLTGMGAEGPMTVGPWNHLGFG